MVQAADRGAHKRFFDWNGVREPFVVATENDSLNGVACCSAISSLVPRSIRRRANLLVAEAVGTRHRRALSGTAEHGIIHLISSVLPLWTVPVNSATQRASRP